MFDGLRFQELGGKNVLDCWEMTNTMQVSVEPHPSKHGREKKHGSWDTSAVCSFRMSPLFINVAQFFGSVLKV